MSRKVLLDAKKNNYIKAIDKIEGMQKIPSLFTIL